MSWFTDEPETFEVGTVMWEEVACNEDVRIWRASVFGGWLIGLGLDNPTFLPDPNHEWKPLLVKDSEE